MWSGNTIEQNQRKDKRTETVIDFHLYVGHHPLNMNHNVAVVKMHKISFGQKEPQDISAAPYFRCSLALSQREKSNM